MKYNVICILSLCALLWGGMSCADSKRAAEARLRPAPERLGQSWRLTSISGVEATSVERLEHLTLEVDLAEKQVRGYNGCNRYFGAIARLDSGVLEFAPLATTRMACPNDALDGPFMEQIARVRIFDFVGDTLSLMSAEGQRLLTFVGQEDEDKGEPDPRLAMSGDDLWVVTQIRGKDVEGARPEFQINLASREVYGSDTCNNLFGKVTKVGAKRLELGLATTLCMCPDMLTADAFREAMSGVRAYRFDGHDLCLLGEDGQELLRCSAMVAVACDA